MAMGCVLIILAVKNFSVLISYTVDINRYDLHKVVFWSPHSYCFKVKRVLDHKKITVRRLNTLKLG